MKTIDERAREYASDELNPNYAIPAYIASKQQKAYIAGATEQKALDIDKACEIVRNIANEYFGDWEQSCKVEDTFLKAMEE